MFSDKARRSHGGEATSTTPNNALQPISRNLRSAQDVPLAASTRRANEFIASRTPVTRQLPLQRTPTSTYAANTTAKRLRATPGRGWTKPSTPHGARALESRRAGQTPARTRRQSARLKKETPRDLLRALTRVMPRPENPSNEARKTLEPTIELPERGDGGDADDDSSIEPTPRLSFAVEEDLSRMEMEKSRRASERLRLSLADSSMVGAGFEDMDDSEDEEQPVTKLLDELIESDDLEPAEDPTFGDRDQLGDTVALRQLMALTRSPLSPQSERDPLTPTGDLSFALDIPDFPLPEQRTPEDQINAGFDYGSPEEEDDEDEDETAGGFEIMIPDHQDEEGAQMQEPQDALGLAAPLEIDRPGTLNAQLARKLMEKKGSRRGVKRGPSRDGLSKGIVKRIATSFIPTTKSKKGRLRRGALDALVQATDWFMEQASEDLAAYSDHAGRRKIDESDFLLLARRQRLLTPGSTLFSLANKYLPRELLREVRGAAGTDGPKSKKRRGESRTAISDAEQGAGDADGG